MNVKRFEQQDIPTESWATWEDTQDLLDCIDEICKECWFSEAGVVYSIDKIIEDTKTKINQRNEQR